MPLLALVLVLGAFAVGYLVLSRMNELFFVSVREGKALVVRGHVPPKLWRELVEVVRRDRVEHGSVRAVKADGRVRLLFSGIGEHTGQRLRNSLGSAGLASMRVHQVRGPRNLGQILGISWLAWLFFNWARD